MEKFHGYLFIEVIIITRSYMLSMVHFFLDLVPRWWWRRMVGQVLGASRASGCLFVCFEKTKQKLKKQDCIQTYFLLLIENSVRQSAQSPAYFYFMMIHTMVTIMNKIYYIYITIYEKLKYDIFLDILLTATHFQTFNIIYENAVHAQKNQISSYIYASFCLKFQLRRSRNEKHLEIRNGVCRGVNRNQSSFNLAK